MFLKRLSIDGDIGNIRTINFHNGLNLIVDATEHTKSNGQETISGNNIGKTTVLKLVNFCLGGDRKEIYTDTENNKNIDKKTKAFLEEHHVIVTLILKESLKDETSSEIIIERNFLTRKQKICRINNVDFNNDNEFKQGLKDLLFPDLEGKSKPTFAQLIANNIRYKDMRINNTINNLDPNTKPIEYETLYLYMLGCPADKGDNKLQLQNEIKREKAFLNKLQREQQKNAYDHALKMVMIEIEEVESKKKQLNINENYEADLNLLDDIKINIGSLGTIISNLKTKLTLVESGINNIDKDLLEVDSNEMKQLYDEVSDRVGNLHKSFEDLLEYHNAMLFQRRQLLEKEKEDLNEKIVNLSNELKTQLKEEKRYTEKVRKCDTLEDLENLSKRSNDLHRKAGEYQSVIKQIDSSISRLENLTQKQEFLEGDVFSEDFINLVHECVEEFNLYFTKYSKKLYDESFQLTEEIKINKEKQRYYRFDPFSMAISSGKKQGETLAFDMAYIEYAQKKGIYHLDFLLNDKKELMDIKQILSITQILKHSDIQLVIPILQDKLHSVINYKDHVVLTLSEDNKLFRIEEIENKYNTSF